MNERTALLRAVCENPDDDTPRLVFADWLDEHDEHERAEFIRIQCLFQSPTARQAAWPEDPATLYHKMTTLRSQHRHAWRAELPTFGRPGEVVWQDFFFRGFVARLEVVDLALFAKHAKELMYASPISHLGIVRAETPNGAAALATLTKIPDVKGVRFFSLGLSGRTDQLTRELETLGADELYQRVSVRFLIPPTAVPGPLRRRINQLAMLAEKHGQRIGC